MLIDKRSRICCCCYLLVLPWPTRPIPYCIHDCSGMTHEIILWPITLSSIKFPINLFDFSLGIFVEALASMLFLIWNGWTIDAYPKASPISNAILTTRLQWYWTELHGYRPSLNIRYLHGYLRGSGLETQDTPETVRPESRRVGRSTILPSNTIATRILAFCSWTIDRAKDEI